MSQSPSQDVKTKKRKQRAILSCFDCRRRKLKCDRELPCNRCIKGGVAHLCHYDQDQAAEFTMVTENPILEDSTIASHPQVSMVERPSIVTSPGATDHSTPQHAMADQWVLDKLEHFEHRLASMESKLPSTPKISRQRNLSLTGNERGQSNKDSTAVTSLFKGHNYSTFAFGPSSPITIVAHFTQVRPFMKEIYPDSSLARVQTETKMLEDQISAQRHWNPTLRVSRISDLLLERHAATALVELYLNTFETTYRILHVPSFWNDYNTFWDLPRGTTSDMEVLILAIMACVICANPNEVTKHHPDGSAFRDKAITWIKTCEQWLKRHSNKHRTLLSLQVRCLRLIAIQATCLKTKEIYQEIQAHIGFARAIGLHRDPEILGVRCSVFEGEMRRRLWATTLELELQASIDRGTPSVLSGFEYDSNPPRNIDDADLNPNMDELPLSKTRSTFTDSSFCNFLMQTAPLRIELCRITNSIKVKPTFEDILSHEKHIHEALESIPEWKDARSLQARTHLDLHLRQFLVILYTSQILEASSFRTNNVRYSVLNCLDSAITLIDRHMALVESRNFTLCGIRSDYYRAALIICHIAYHANHQSDGMISRSVQAVFEDAMTKALRILEERCIRPGRGLKQYWYISAASSLVRIQFAPERAEEYKRQATDRVSRIQYRVLSMQDDVYDDCFIKEVVLEEPSTVTGPNNSHNLDALCGLATEELTTPGLRLDAFDVENPSEWLLDDYWLFNDFQPLEKGR